MLTTKQPRANQPEPSLEPQITIIPSTTFKPQDSAAASKVVRFSSTSIHKKNQAAVITRQLVTRVTTLEQNCSKISEDLAHLKSLIAVINGLQNSIIHYTNTISSANQFEQIIEAHNNLAQEIFTKAYEFKNLSNSSCNNLEDLCMIFSSFFHHNTITSLGISKDSSLNLNKVFKISNSSLAQYYAKDCLILEPIIIPKSDDEAKIKQLIARLEEAMQEDIDTCNSNLTLFDLVQGHQAAVNTIYEVWQELIKATASQPNISIYAIYENFISLFPARFGLTLARHLVLFQELSAIAQSWDIGCNLLTQNLSLNFSAIFNTFSDEAIENPQPSSSSSCQHSSKKLKPST